MYGLTEVCRLSSRIAVIRKFPYEDADKGFDIGIHVNGNTVIVVSLEQIIDDIPLIYIIREFDDFRDANDEFINLVGAFTFMEPYEGTEYFKHSISNKHKMYGNKRSDIDSTKRYFNMAIHVRKEYERNEFSGRQVSCLN